MTEFENTIYPITPIIIFNSYHTRHVTSRGFTYSEPCCYGTLYRVWQHRALLRWLSNGGFRGATRALLIFITDYPLFCYTRVYTQQQLFARLIEFITILFPRPTWYFRTTFYALCVSVIMVSDINNHHERRRRTLFLFLSFRRFRSVAFIAKRRRRRRRCVVRDHTLG